MCLRQVVVYQTTDAIDKGFVFVKISTIKADRMPLKREAGWFEALIRRLLSAVCHKVVGFESRQYNDYWMGLN